MRNWRHFWRRLWTVDKLFCFVFVGLDWQAIWTLLWNYTYKLDPGPTVTPCMRAHANFFLTVLPWGLPHLHCSRTLVLHKGKRRDAPWQHIKVEGRKVRCTVFHYRLKLLSATQCVGFFPETIEMIFLAGNTNFTFNCKGLEVTRIRARSAQLNFTILLFSVWCPLVSWKTHNIRCITIIIIIKWLTATWLSANTLPIK